VIALARFKCPTQRVIKTAHNLVVSTIRTLFKLA
jgi:hypothetical protein